MFPVCATCGVLFRGGRCCPICNAAPPKWQRSPLSASNLVAGVGGLVGGLFCVGFAVSIARLPDASLGVFGRAAVVLVTGVLGLALLWLSVVGALLEREWTHSVDGEPDATAVTRPGRVVRGRGGGRTAGAPIVVPPNALRGVEAFAHYEALRRVVSKQCGVDMIAKVDGAVVAALLDLVGRGALEMRVVRHFVWSQDGGRTTLQEPSQSIDVRRAHGASRVESGIIERALLDAVEPSQVTAAPLEAPRPYRVAAAITPSSNVSEWAPLSLVLLTMSDGLSTFRRALRARLVAALAEATDLRREDEVVAEFVATLDTMSDRFAATALFWDVARGFELRD